MPSSDGSNSRQGSKGSTGSRGKRKPGGDGGLSFLTEPIDAGSPQAAEPAPAELVEEEEEEPIHEFEPEEPCHDKRRLGMLAEVNMRAEHQLSARNALLDLAHELEETLKLRKVAEVAVLEEKKLHEQTKSKFSGIWKIVKEEQQKTEVQRAKHFVDKIKHGVNEGILTAAALLWSRIALPIDRVGEGLSEEERARMEVYEEFRFDLPDERPHEEILEWPLDRSGKQLAIKGVRLRGDGLMLMWMIRGWATKVEEMRRQRLQAAEAEAELLARKKEMQAEMDKMKSGFEKQLTEERAKSRGTDGVIRGLKEEIEKLKHKIQDLERELAVKQVPIVERVVEKVQEVKKDDIYERYQHLVDVVIPGKDLVISERDEVIKGLEVQIVKMEAEFAEEKKALKVQVQTMTQEVDRLIIFAKHLKDSWMKAKRDAAANVSPEKFSQLVTMLEDMREKLVVIGHENTTLRNETGGLHRRIGQNRRRLELERQFLPLLHKVRGPVGPKNPLFTKNQAEMAAINMVPDEMGPGGVVGSPPEKLRMAHSQSTGALEPIGKPANRPDIKGSAAANGHRLQG